MILAWHFKRSLSMNNFSLSLTHSLQIQIVADGKSLAKLKAAATQCSLSILNRLFTITTAVTAEYVELKWKVNGCLLHFMFFN